MLYYLLVITESGFDYPQLMQNISLGLLALFTPLALFLFSPSKENENGLFFFDKMVILDQVLKGKWLALNVLLILLLQFLYAYDILRWLVFILFFFGLFNISRILVKCYQWIAALESKKGNFRESCRDTYFRENRNWSDKSIIWATIWDGENVAGTEVEQFEKFTNDINFLMAERNFSVVRDYVSSFNDSIRKRHLENWHLFRMVWTKSLEWHFTFYELELGAEGDTSSFNDPISQIKGIATKLLNDVFLRGIIDNNAFLCFKMLEQHAEGKQQLYLIELFHRISETFFENIYKSNEKYDIWNSYFPRDWLITKANLDARKPVVMVLWERFINWGSMRFSGQSEGYDYDLDEVTRNLFKTSDPDTLSSLLFFLDNGWVNDDRMGSLVSCGKRFGGRGHSVSTVNISMDEHHQIVDNRIRFERKEAFDVINFFFSQSFTKDKLVSYIGELEGLELTDETENHRKDKFILLFKEMLDYLYRDNLFVDAQ